MLEINVIVCEYLDDPFHMFQFEFSTLEQDYNYLIITIQVYTRLVLSRVLSAPSACFHCSGTISYTNKHPMQFVTTVPMFTTETKTIARLHAASI